MDQAELFEENNRDVPKDCIEHFLPGSREISSDLSALFELSVDAFYAALFARMSCLPIEGEISRFIKKVLAAENAVSNTSDARTAAAKIAFDRGDPDVLTVLNTSYKVQHETHRLVGLLRFSPDSAGVYIARCSPDFFILPALADHFTLRFGDIPWAIIDEKRGLCLKREKGLEPQITPASPEPGDDSKGFWEDLWRLYHKSINNEGRKNLELQRQLMPKRYWDYLTEKR